MQFDPTQDLQLCWAGHQGCKVMWDMWAAVGTILAVFAAVLLADAPRRQQARANREKLKAMTNSMIEECAQLVRTLNEGLLSIRIDVVALGNLATPIHILRGIQIPSIEHFVDETSYFNDDAYIALSSLRWSIAYYTRVLAQIERSTDELGLQRLATMLNATNLVMRRATACNRALVPHVRYDEGTLEVLSDIEENFEKLIAHNEVMSRQIADRQRELDIAFQDAQSEPERKH